MANTASRVSIPYRFNERRIENLNLYIMSKFQFLIGSMKEKMEMMRPLRNSVSIPYRFNERWVLDQKYIKLLKVSIPYRFNERWA